MGFIVGALCASGVSAVYILSTQSAVSPGLPQNIDIVPRTVEIPTETIVDEVPKSIVEPVVTASVPEIQKIPSPSSTIPVPLPVQPAKETRMLMSAQEDTGARTDAYFSHVTARIQREACKNIATLDRDKAWLAGCHVAKSFPAQCTEAYARAKDTLDGEQLENFMKTCACDIPEEFGIVLERGYTEAVSTCISAFK